MAKDKPSDQEVRRQQLDDEESASIDEPQADRLREQQSSSSGASANKQQNARGTREDATRSEKVQDELDDALAASFPASDPVSIVTSQEEEDWGPGAQSNADNEKSKGSRRDSSQPRR